ncbi:MAG: glycosyltransferase family 9 protein [Dysgonomonas sp.]
MSRVLITRISSFGDVAMLVPVIFSVAEKYPQDRFTVLTRKAFTPLFENLGFNINVRSFDVQKHGSVFGLLRLTFSLLKGGYSHVADVHDVTRTKVIRKAFLLEGKKVAHIDKGREEKKKMIESKVLQPPLKHTIERYLDVFEKIGFSTEITFKNYFEFKDRSLYPLRNITTRKEHKWIGIAPFAKHKGKIYPLEKNRKNCRLFFKKIRL